MTALRPAVIRSSCGLSGLWMLGRVAKQVVQSDGRFEMPLAWIIMAVLGV